ncbi:MAG: transporter substrate-binding domain-containing protein [Alteromonadaceae bacterium]|nr:transporter substrate-binding domain-containing protein [Alteromonadaceae bacterium]
MFQFIVALKFLVLILSILLPFLSKASSLSIAGIDKCPQICVNKNKPGYIVEIVNTVFAESPYTIEVDYYPWSRAIKLVREGKVTALLSPAKAEAPDLRYPVQEVGRQQMCFFTGKDSIWQYTGPDSLKGQQIGVSVDSSIEELNAYLKQHPEQFQFQPYHERYLEQNAGKVSKNRIDSFLFTYNSTIYELNRLGIANNFRSAGCVSTTNVYMAFSNKGTNQQEITQMMAYFDQRMVQLHQKGIVQKIMDKYQLNSWR